MSFLVATSPRDNTLLSCKPSVRVLKARISLEYFTSEALRGKDFPAVKWHRDSLCGGGLLFGALLHHTIPPTSGKSLHLFSARDTGVGSFLVSCRCGGVKYGGNLRGDDIYSQRNEYCALLTEGPTVRRCSASRCFGGGITSSTGF